MEDIKDDKADTSQNESDIEKGEKEKRREEREEKKKYPYRDLSLLTKLRFYLTIGVNIVALVITLSTFASYYNSVSVQTLNT
jgi:hypothetical protein